MLKLDSLSTRSRIVTPAGDAIRAPIETTLRMLADMHCAQQQQDYNAVLETALAPGTTTCYGDPHDVIALFLEQFQRGNSDTADIDTTEELICRLCWYYGYAEWWDKPYPVVLALASWVEKGNTYERMNGALAANASTEQFRSWQRSLRPTPQPARSLHEFLSRLPPSMATVPE